MKKILFTGSLLAIIISCQKNKPTATIENQGITSTTTVQDEIRNARRYIAEDGKSVQVMKGIYHDHPYIKIKSNGKDIQVINQNSNDTLRYEENGIIVLQEGDSLKIEQQNQVIKLRRAK